MMDQQSLRLTVEASRVRTFGLGSIEHPDLTMRAACTSHVEQAQRTLLRLASYVVSCGTTLRPGDTFIVDGGKLKLEAAGSHLLEVVHASSLDTS